MSLKFGTAIEQIFLSISGNNHRYKTCRHYYNIWKHSQISYVQTLLHTVAKYKIQKQITHYQSAVLSSQCHIKGEQCNNSVQRS